MLKTGLNLCQKQQLVRPKEPRWYGEPTDQPQFWRQDPHVWRAPLFLADQLLRCRKGVLKGPYNFQALVPISGMLQTPFKGRGACRDDIGSLLRGYGASHKEF